MRMKTGALERLLGPGEVVETPAGVEHCHRPATSRGGSACRSGPPLEFEAWLERIATLDYLPGGWPQPVDAARLVLEFDNEAHAAIPPLRVQQAAARGVVKLAETAQSRR